MRHRKPPGGLAKLTEQQRRQLPEVLAQGPAAYGFDGEIWTRQRVAQVIRQEFGVYYDPTQVGRILQPLGWSPQQPATSPAGHAAG